MQQQQQAQPQAQESVGFDEGLYELANSWDMSPERAKHFMQTELNEHFQRLPSYERTRIDSLGVAGIKELRESYMSSKPSTAPEIATSSTYMDTTPTHKYTRTQIFNMSESERSAKDMDILQAYADGRVLDDLDTATGDVREYEKSAAEAQMPQLLSPTAMQQMRTN